jgi:predicted protein tyrosine phosphatase
MSPNHMPTVLVLLANERVMASTLLDRRFHVNNDSKEKLGDDCAHRQTVKRLSYWSNVLVEEKRRFEKRVFRRFQTWQRTTRSIIIDLISENIKHCWHELNNCFKVILHSRRIFAKQLYPTSIRSNIHGWFNLLSRLCKAVIYCKI